MANRWPAEWLEHVRVVTIDPHEPYRLGLSPKLSHATVVADPFHIVRLANRAIDDARRRTARSSPATVAGGATPSMTSARSFSPPPSD